MTTKLSPTLALLLVSLLASDKLRGILLTIELSLANIAPFQSATAPACSWQALQNAA